MNCEIPLKPISKKNSQQIVKPKGLSHYIITQSKQYKAYEKACLEFLKNQEKPDVVIDFPVNFRCIYMIQRNKDGSVPKNAPDLVNLLEATLDIFVKAKIIKDDNSTIVCGHDGSRVVFTDGIPKTLVQITRMI